MTRSSVRAALLLVLLAPAVALAQPPAGGFEPKVGMSGKDTPWVPTPDAMVEKMLDLGEVTPRDYVVDLGSGDGRNVIAAAKRGARALGVEYNPDLVEYSKNKAAEAGVADKATFVQGDMFEAEFADATVLTLFLLPDNLRKLMPKFLALKPGTRIVANTFGLSGWTAEKSYRMEDCQSWCEAMLYIVPARVAGRWQIDRGVLELTQEAQTVQGALIAGEKTLPLQDVAIRGAEIRFTVDGASYTGRVNGETIDGTMKNGSREARFRATRASR